MAKKWLDRLGSNKARALILLAIGIFFVVIIAIVFSTRKPNPLETDKSQTTKVPQITAIPGGATSEKYQELQEADNRRIAEQAKKKGGSAIATIIGNKDNDLLSKKESFGIEGEFLKACECKCPPPPATPIKPACPKDLALALKSIENDKVAAKKMLFACPAMAKLLAEKNPEMFKQLMLENPDLAKLIGDTYPEVLKKLMDSDPEFARQLAKTNPDLVKSLMKNDSAFAARTAKANPEMFKQLMLDDPAFAKVMAANNPDMIATLMDNDPAFAKALLLKVPDINTIVNSNRKKIPPITDKQRLQALEETRRKQQVEQLSRAKQTQLSEVQQKQLTALITSMEAQSKKAFEVWDTSTTQAFVQGDKKDDKDAAGGGASSAGGNGANGNRGSGGSANDRVLIKAGTILFAALDTAVNTDEPGPIMATIVQGEYQGAKVIGTTQLSTQPGNDRPERVTLNFVTMSTPAEAKSLSIQGVAIDPDTARTALASDVDHHYLLRYGTLFASSFMNGYAKVITSEGTTQTNSGTGTTSTTTEKLSGRKEIFAALGEVGKKFGEATSTYFATPNTITVNAGTGIGLLILADVKATQ